MKGYFRNMSFTFRGRAALWIAVLAKAVSFFGDQVATIALLLRLQDAGGSAIAVAGLLMASLAPIVLLSPVAGRLVDRCGSRVLLATSGALQAALCTGLVFVSGTPATLALVALLGAGQAVNGATWQALVPSLVPAEELPRALGLGQAANTVGLIAAPAVAGVLTAWAGARPAIAVDALTFVAVAVAGLVVPDRRAAVAPGRLPGGLAIVRRDALLRTTVSLLGLFVLLGSMVNVVDVFLVRETLGADAVWYGLTGAGYAVGLLGGALLGGRLRGVGRLARAFVVASALLGAGLAGMGLAPSVQVLLVVAAGTGAFNGVVNVATSALIFGRAAAAERGRVAALIGGVASGAQLGAYAAGGALAEVLSPRTIFVLAGCLGLLVPLALCRGLLRVATPAPAASPAAVPDRALAA